jgi:hypothetical protein
MRMNIMDIMDKIVTGVVEMVDVGEIYVLI